MKNKAKTFLTSLIIFFLISFNNKSNNSEEELPQWLINKIEKDENEIKANDQIWYASGKWIKTKWNNIYWYEYTNVLSSIASGPISHSGDTLDFYNNFLFKQYNSEKRCQSLIWKGPNHINND